MYMYNYLNMCNEFDLDVCSYEVFQKSKCQVYSKF